MAITYVGGKTFAFAGTTSAQTISLTDLTGGSDTAPSAGDFVLVAYGVGSTVSRAITVNSSYTNLTKLTADDFYDTNLAVGYKFMGGTPDTSVQVSGTGDTADAGAGVIHVFRGVDATDPFGLGDSPEPLTGSNGHIPTFEDQILQEDEGGEYWPVFIAACAHAGGVDTYSSSDLDHFRSVGSNDTYDVTVGAGVKKPAVGQSDLFAPATWTHSQATISSYSWASYSLTVYSPAPEAVTGTASGDLALTGSATGTVRVAGAASGTLDLTGSAAGAVAVAGVASGDLPLTGSATAATGDAPVTGEASGTLPLTGAASGLVLAAGAAAGTLPLTGSAAGAVSVVGAATGDLALTGSAAGVALVAGAASGTLPLTGTTTGVVLVVGVASGALPITGAGAATAELSPATSGIAVGGLPILGSAAAVVLVRGAVLGAIPLTGTSTLVQSGWGTSAPAPVQPWAQVPSTTGPWADLDPSAAQPWTPLLPN